MRRSLDGRVDRYANRMGTQQADGLVTDRFVVRCTLRILRLPDPAGGRRAGARHRVLTGRPIEVGNEIYKPRCVGG